MGTPQIPKTQQDALPLQTIAGALAGDIQVVGNALTRYWAPSVTGISGSFRTNIGASASFILSNFLDVRGCNQFQAIMVRNALTVTGDDTTRFRMFLQYRAGGTGGVQPIALNASLSNLTFYSVVGTCTPDAGGGGYPQSIPLTQALGFSNNFLNAATAEAGVKTIGTDVRFLFVWDALNPGNINQSWDLHLWGAT
jgi:hypothetical protein